MYIQNSIQLFCGYMCGGYNLISKYKLCYKCVYSVLATLQASFGKEKYKQNYFKMLFDIRVSWTVFSWKIKTNYNIHIP